MWAAINAALWFCFAWFIAGYSQNIWLIAAYTYGGLLVFHFIISLRPGYVPCRVPSIVPCQVAMMKVQDLSQSYPLLVISWVPSREVDSVSSWHSAPMVLSPRMWTCSHISINPKTLTTTGCLRPLKPLNPAGMR